MTALQNLNRRDPRLVSGMVAALQNVSKRDLRLASGMVMLLYLATHLANAALGLVSLHAAEAALNTAVAVWQSVPGTILLYGAALTHVTLAVLAIYERRTFWLPPVELLRIALGLWMPVMLIGHAITTRLEAELFGELSSYSRIVSNLWVTDGEWYHMGLLAPGWLHGCLGLHFAFRRRTLWRQFRFALFAFALLLPVLSALGFLEMGRELAREGRVGPDAILGAMNHLPTATADDLAAAVTIVRWRQGLLFGYLGLIGCAFTARTLRNLVEQRRGQVTISYPDRTVRVPRGWSVLEASRAFHIAHSSSCGGRARCSTCRVNVTAGADLCPPPGPDELATLKRIRAEPDIRLACQLRPQKDISVIPLVRTDRPVYRPTAPEVDAEREVVLLFCDFTNRVALERQHLAHDVLFVFTRYAESACSAIAGAGGTISYVAHDSICALFGTSGSLQRAARQALAATIAVEYALAEINVGLDQRWGCKADVVVTVHAGRAAMSHIGRDVDTIMAGGHAVDAANELRARAAEADKAFAVSSAVFAAAEMPPPAEAAAVIALASEPKLSAYLSDTAPGNTGAPRPWWRENLAGATDLIKTIVAG